MTQSFHEKKKKRKRKTNKLKREFTVDAFTLEKFIEVNLK